VGGWTDLMPGFCDNYYFSIRRYPYTADMTKNPLTFRHISDGVVLPAGPPINPNAGGPNNAVHNAGEVWCSALWEVFVNLVAKYKREADGDDDDEEEGHEKAEKRMLTYVIGGLKLTPPNPTFTQARDGIIAAVTALHPEDLPEVWAGFAKRGMGVGAASPPATSTSLAGVVESFNVP
jgi:extracellular elastinolytic metalloproteinase